MSSVEVFIWPSTRVGTLHLHRRGAVQSASFVYDATYLARPEAYPVDPALPLGAGAFHSAQPLFGAFSDTAPDRWGRTLVDRSLAAEARAAGATPRQPGEGDYLLGVRDDLRQGALRFRLADDAPDAFRATAESGVPAMTDLADLVGLAQKVLDDEATTQDLRRLVRAGSSLGGARPKAHVRLPDGSFGIAKFPAHGHDDWNVMAWEQVVLTLADRAGVVVPDHLRVDAGGHDVLVLRRFDRRGEERLGYASAMTLLEASDGDRASYLDIAEVVEENSPRPVQDLRQLWRRIVFGALVNNTDDHLRNHGFLRRGRGWALSPAFDLNPTPYEAPFATDVVDAGDGGSLEAALEVSGSFRLSLPQAREVLGEVADAVRTWWEVAALEGIGEPERRRMAPAFRRAEETTAR